MTPARLCQISELLFPVTVLFLCGWISDTPFSFWMFPENWYMIFLKINNWVVSCCCVFPLEGIKGQQTQNLKNNQIKQTSILSSYFQSQGSERVQHPYSQLSTGLDETLAECITNCSPFAFWENASYLPSIGVSFSLNLKRRVGPPDGWFSARLMLPTQWIFVNVWRHFHCHN